jgi:protein involved in polysaccharide export with SLBB domain
MEYSNGNAIKGFFFIYFFLSLNPMFPKFFQQFVWIVLLSNSIIVSASSLSENVLMPEFYESAIIRRSGLSLQPVYLESKIDSPYVVGVGDFFELLLEENSYTIQVSPDGYFSVEGVGMIQLDGMELSAAREAILQLVSKRYRREYCFVHLAHVKRFRIGIYGALARPGHHLTETGMRISTLVSQLGGFLPNADKSSVRIFRGQDTLVYDFFKAAYEGDITQDPLVQQGDFVYIPFLNAANPSVYIRTKDHSVASPWKQGMTFSEYFERSGLSVLVPLWKKAVISSKQGNVMTLPLEEAVHYVPQSGDEIELVEDQLWVYVGGNMASPGRQPYVPGATAMEYIVRSGMIHYSGDLHQLTVVRSNGKAEPIHPTNGVIHPGDFIHLPRNRYERFKDFSIFLSVLATLVLTVVTINNERK